MSTELVNRIVVCPAIGADLEVREAPVPAVTDDGLLVRVELAGCCATDLHLVHGRIPGVPFPISPGHEAVGIVEEVGSNFGVDMFGVALEPGQRVAIMPATPCGECSSCQLDPAVPDCTSFDVVGFSEPQMRPAGGGFATFIHCPSPRTRVIVTDAPAELAVLTEPAATPVEGLERASFEFGSSVLVQGTGTVGLLAVVAALAYGASTVDVVGGPAARLDLARCLGASRAFDIAHVPDFNNRIGEVLSGTRNGAGYDVVIECAGRPAAIAEGLKYVRKNGTYIELGHFSDAGEVSINPYTDLLQRDIRLIASSGYSARSFAKALSVVANGGDELRALVTHRVPLDRAGDALNALTPEANWTFDGIPVGKILIEPSLASSSSRPFGTEN